MARRLDRGARLVLASHNPGKLEELADLLRPHGISVIAAASIGLPEPEEDAPDFAGNARIKAVAAAGTSGLPALADDSGFCVAALHGAPGIHSARWAGPAKDFDAAMKRVNREAAGGPDRRAWFVAALCIAWPDGHTETFVGRVDGQMTWPPRGTNGFGYDPMFIPAGAAATFGEMDAAEKRTLSHRARAFAQMMRSCLFADAEPGEQRVEDVLHADAAGDAPERP
jgi:XTP/dITP diphosphohydrolase